MPCVVIVQQVVVPGAISAADLKFFTDYGRLA
jgi:hypothetical protein